MFQVNEDVFKNTLEVSMSDLKVTLVSGVHLWLCSVGDSDFPEGTVNEKEREQAWCWLFILRQLAEGT